MELGHWLFDFNYNSERKKKPYWIENTAYKTVHTGRECLWAIEFVSNVYDLFTKVEQDDSFIFRTEDF